jgi:UDP-GlcNAc:undecaprenyl-phosphate GlcNAc-1-phosphate transferase
MIQSSQPLAFLYPVVLLLSLAGTGAVRHWARRYGWVARPRADRWHQQPTALHGGVGFYPAFFVGACATILWATGSSWRAWESFDSIPQELALAASLLVGSLIMFFLGLWDDLAELRPATKFVGQLVAASLFIFAGGSFELTGIPVLDLLVTYFWFVGITNAVNMLDNMDGLASGVVILSGTTVVALALGINDFAWDGELAVPIGLSFVAAVLGFWLYNRPPASIFMGDSGSLSIGYILAALAIPGPLNDFLGISSHGTVLTSVLALIIPATVLAIPIFDTTLVTLTRKFRAQPASQGGRDHSSHRLVGLGLSESHAVWALYMLSGAGGVLAILMQQFPRQAFPLFGVFLAILFISGVYLGHVKVQVADPAKPPPAWTPLVTKFFYKRRAAEVLLDTIFIILCYYSAYLLRFDGQISEDTNRSVLHALPLVVASCLVAHFMAALYRRQWRLITVSDLPRYVAGVAGGTVLSLAIVTLVTRFEIGQSRSAYIIFGLLLFLVMVGARLSFRLLDTLIYRQQADFSRAGITPVLIYGAGKGGKLVFEEVMSQPELREYVVAGFVDDDPYQDGRSLCGRPVMLPSRWIDSSIASPVEIWISSRSIPDSRAQALAQNWYGQAQVRRVRVTVEPVPELANVPSAIPLPTMHGTLHPTIPATEAAPHLYR